MNDYLRQVILLFLSPLLTLTLCHAQGTIKGKVTDDTENPVLFGNVALYEGGNLAKGTQTDFDGNYLISNVDSGTYDLEVSYVGLQAKKITEIRISGDETKFIDVQLRSGVISDDVEVVKFQKELFIKGETKTGGTVTPEETKNLGGHVNEIAANTAERKIGEDGQVTIRGGRGSNTVYYSDGFRIRGAATFPPTPKMLRKAKRQKKKQLRKDRKLKKASKHNSPN